MAQAKTKSKAIIGTEVRPQILERPNIMLQWAGSSSARGPNELHAHVMLLDEHGNGAPAVVKALDGKGGVIEKDGADLVISKVLDADDFGELMRLLALLVDQAEANTTVEV